MDPSRPLMLDMTKLVRKPPDRHWIVGVEVRTRTAVAAVIGAVLMLPIAAPLFRFGAANIAILAVVAGGGAGLLALAWRPEGLPFGAWVAAKLREGRGKTFLADGTEVSLYVGLAPLRDSMAGQRLTLEMPAVEVAPGRYDKRGAPIEEAA